MGVEHICENGEKIEENNQIFKCDLLPLLYFVCLFWPIPNRAAAPVGAKDLLNEENFPTSVHISLTVHLCICPLSLLTFSLVPAQNGAKPRGNLDSK